MASGGASGDAPANPVRLERAAALLAKAIVQGDVDRAKSLTETLAQSRAEVNVHLQEKENKEGKTPLEEILIKVTVEDKHSAGGSFPLKVSPKMTFSQLKKQVQTSHKFRIEEQRWIVGKRLAKDSRSLASYGVNMTDFPLYLYLSSTPNCSGENNTQPSSMSQSLDTQTLPTFNEFVHVSVPRSQTTPDLLPSPVNSPPIKPIVEESTHTVEAAPEDRLLLLEEPTQSAEPNTNETRETATAAEIMGWSCPRCTLHNEPTRPTCEVCGKERPEWYEVPENAIDFASDRERQRLLQEQSDRRYVEEMERQGQLEEEQLSIWEAQLQLTELEDLVTNPCPFTCTLCQRNVDEHEGIMLKECMHCFCRPCMEEHVEGKRNSVVYCPYFDSTTNEVCEIPLEEREKLALIFDSDESNLVTEANDTAD